MRYHFVHDIIARDDIVEAKVSTHDIYGEEKKLWIFPTLFIYFSFIYIFEMTYRFSGIYIVAA